MNLRLRLATPAFVDNNKTKTQKKNCIANDDDDDKTDFDATKNERISATVALRAWSVKSTTHSAYAAFSTGIDFRLVSDQAANNYRGVFFSARNTAGHKFFFRSRFPLANKHHPFIIFSVTIEQEKNKYKKITTNRWWYEEVAAQNALNTAINLSCTLLCMLLLLWLFAYSAMHACMHHQR